MRKIALFDTSICSGNAGDYIIMDSANDLAKNMFPGDFFVRVQTHDKIGQISYRHIESSDIRLLCGTNLLSSNMNTYNQWKINLIDGFKLKDIILLGVGWWQYQDKPNLYTRYLLKQVLHKEHIHSVRDKYTLNKLKEIGITNAVNTGCPTLWGLDEDHCQMIPKKKGKDVLFTITDYHKNHELDKAMIQILEKNYEQCYCWLQGTKDKEYLSEIINIDNIKFIPPTVDHLDKFLSSNKNFDFVGTRLHCGIRVMQRKIRSIIIGVDNRALEKKADFNLVVLDRKDVNRDLEQLLNSSIETKINLPINEIKRWKNQFNSI